MPQRATSRRNAGWFKRLTGSKVTYHRDVAKERKELRAQALQDRRDRLTARKLEAEERAVEAKIAAADRKLASAEKKVDRGGMTEARFEAVKASLQREIERQEEHKRAIQAKNPCAITKKSHVTDRAKRYRANQPGCKPAGAKKCAICRSKRYLTIDHKDGNEANGKKSNLRWLCKSCNTRLGAEFARRGIGTRTEQFNPKGATSFGQWSEAVATLAGEGLGEMTVDQARDIVHKTSKARRSEFNTDVWRIRKERYGPSGRKSGGASDVPDWVTNPEMPMESSTEYRLGYNLGQGDRQTASLRQTPGELHATFAANFGSVPSANWEAFEQAYQAGYGGRIGAAAPNPQQFSMVGEKWEYAYRGKKKGVWRTLFATSTVTKDNGATVTFSDGRTIAKEELVRSFGTGKNPSARRNPDTDTDEYRQAKKIAELFHGRPVKEEITVTEDIRTHDWLWRIGPLVKLVIKPLTKKPRPTVPLPFPTDEENQVHLFCSPDGRQFYLRGGDQELDLKALGMGPGTEWFRDHMLIGEAKEITYRDKKKFHKFKVTDYFHKLGEVTRKKPMMAYNALAHKIEIFGGQYRVEDKDLVDGMSPGIVN